MTQRRGCGNHGQLLFFFLNSQFSWIVSTDVLYQNTITQHSVFLESTLSFEKKNSKQEHIIITLERCIKNSEFFYHRVAGVIFTTRKISRCCIILDEASMVGSFSVWTTKQFICLLISDIQYNMYLFGIFLSLTLPSINSVHLRGILHLREGFPC